MPSLVGLALLGAVLAFHTLVAAVMTRFFRLRMKTQIGWVLYSLVLTPVALVLSTMVFTGVLNIGQGVNFGGPTPAFAVMVGVPLALGFTIDVLYVPAPDEYELPETRG